MAEIKETEVRIDVYLWSVRLFKSRSQATEACKNGKISINGYSVKPSRNIHSGVTFEMRDNPITRTYVVKQILQKRVGAKFVPEYLEETTAPDVETFAGNHRKSIHHARPRNWTTNKKR